MTQLTYPVASGLEFWQDAIEELEFSTGSINLGPTGEVTWFKKQTLKMCFKRGTLKIKINL